MDFTVEFYETPSGTCPVQEFLDKLKAIDPDDFTAVVAGLAKLRNRQYHHEPLSKALGEGLFELRHVGKLNARVLWFFTRGRRIVLLHGIRNKGQAIPMRDLAIARERMRECTPGRHDEKNQLRSVPRKAAARSGVSRAF